MTLTNGQGTVDFMDAFGADVVSAVLKHMNEDHQDDSVLIARAFGNQQAVSAEMTGLDGSGGYWTYQADGITHDLMVTWSQPITERPQIRREVTALYDAACAKLGITPREHD